MSEPGSDRPVSGPLAGLRVLDLSRVLAGPWATQMLADLGADVLKIERPGSGDETRGWGPPWIAAADGSGERFSAYFVAANRGKRSAAIDMADPAGAARIRALAQDCDVVVENFKVGGLVRYGLDAASLRALNPPLIYCSISGFGQDGPLADRPGYDFVIQGMAGLMSVTGETDGAPTKAGVALVDVMTGLYAGNAILAALHRRERTGEGAHIDLALFDVGLAAMANQAANRLATASDPGRRGNAHPNIVPYQAFDTADGAITVAVGNDAQFARLAASLGSAEWAADPRFRTNAARVEHRDILVPRIAAVFASRTAAEWLAALAQADVPAGPINGLGAALSGPQALHRGMTIVRDTAAVGPVAMVGCPIRIDGQRQDAVCGPPALGQHEPAWRQRVWSRLAPAAKPGS